MGCLLACLLATQGVLLTMMIMTEEYAKPLTLLLVLLLLLLLLMDH
jgi:hypothetical protein